MNLGWWNLNPPLRTASVNPYNSLRIFTEICERLNINWTFWIGFHEPAVAQGSVCYEVKQAYFGSLLMANGLIISFAKTFLHAFGDWWALLLNPGTTHANRSFCESLNIKWAGLEFMSPKKS